MLVVGCWLLVVGCWLLVVGSSPGTRSRSPLRDTRRLNSVGSTFPTLSMHLRGARPNSSAVIVELHVRVLGQ
ncbi:MAG: hypothetical protein ACK557_18240 [Planctomycetota bacterium]